MTRNIPVEGDALLIDIPVNRPWLDRTDRIWAEGVSNLTLDQNPSHSSEPPTQPTEGPKRPQRTPLAYGRSNSDFRPRDFSKHFCRFLTNNPTVFHAVDRVGTQLTNHGYTKLSERNDWSIKAGGKYYIERNGSSLVAFAVGKDYKPGNGIAMIAGHVDALTVKVKPIPGLETKMGYVQLGVAPYAGGLNSTWWDRDLGIAGKVLVKDKNGKIVSKLVNLNQPIARIPTLAPHFGAISQGPFNQETQMVPIIGVDNSDEEMKRVGDVGTFAATQPPALVKAIAAGLGTEDYNSIVNWELELYDVQPATVGGLNKELIYGGRIDDKLCSWAAIQALMASTHEGSEESTASGSTNGSSSIKLVALFDNEEIGSLTRQGAQSDLLSSTISRAVESLHASTNSVSSSTPCLTPPLNPVHPLDQPANKTRHPSPPQSSPAPTQTPSSSRQT